MKKKIISMMLAILVMVSCLVLPASAAANFTDVSSGAWYTKFVNYVYDNGLMAGTTSTTFEPNAKMTRAMAVTVLYRVAGSPEISGSNPFTDVSASRYCYKPVMWAVANGITSGTTKTSFSPNQYVTREQLVTFLYRYAESAGLVDNVGGSLNYPDAGSVSGYAVTPFLWCTSNGIIAGTAKGLLAPKATATRAECATILTRFDELMKGIVEPDPIEPSVTEPPVTEPPVTEPSVIEPEPSDLMANVPNGRIIKMRGLYTSNNIRECMIAPAEEDFGKYYDNAVAIYQGLLDGEERFILEFDQAGEDGNAEAFEFEVLFNEKVFQSFSKLGIIPSDKHDDKMDGRVLARDIDETFERIRKDAAAYHEENIRAGVCDGLTEKEAIRRINAQICSRLSYDLGFEYYDGVEALEAGKGTCNAYTLIFQGMCDDAGIVCRRVYGRVESGVTKGSHGWNQVWLNGAWYHIDTCWNDCRSPENGYMPSKDLWPSHVMNGIFNY